MKVYVRIFCLELASDKPDHLLRVLWRVIVSFCQHVVQRPFIWRYVVIKLFTPGIMEVVMRLFIAYAQYFADRDPDASEVAVRHL